MKILTRLLVVPMLLGLVAGCQGTPTEVTYKEVSVGSMRLSIPTEWQRPEDIEEIAEDFISDVGSEMEQYVQFDGYEDPKSQDFGLVLVVMEISKSIESEGMTWEGWESALEAEGMIKEDFLSQFIAGFISEGVEELTKTRELQHMIHGYEAVEAQLTYKEEGKPWLANLLLIFPETDLGLVVIVGEESALEKHEDTWYKIRDSVQF